MAVCCALAAVLNLTLLGYPSITAQMCDSRCTSICYGYGKTATLPCVGCSVAPTVEPSGCGAGTVQLKTFVNKTATRPRGGAGYQIAGSSGARGGVQVRFHEGGAGVYTALAPLEAGTDIQGPGMLACAKGMGHITLMAGSVLNNVTVINCSDTCPLHIALPRTVDSHQPVTAATLQTTVSNVTVRTTSECAVVVEPVELQRSHEAHGSVVIAGLTVVHPVPPPPPPPGTVQYNVVVSNIDGVVSVVGPAWNTTAQGVMLFESTGGSTVLSVPDGTQVHNLSADLGLFSADYLIEYAHGGQLYRGRELKWLPKTNEALGYAAVGLTVMALLGGAELASVKESDGD